MSSVTPLPSVKNEDLTPLPSIFHPRLLKELTGMRRSRLPGYIHQHRVLESQICISSPKFRLQTEKGDVVD